MAGAATQATRTREEVKPLSKAEKALLEKETRKANEAAEKKIKVRFRAAEKLLKDAGKKPQYCVLDPANETIETVARAFGYAVVHEAKKGANFDLLEKLPEGAEVVKDENAPTPAEKKRGPKKRDPGAPVRLDGGVPISYAVFITGISLIPNSPLDQRRTLISGTQPDGRTKSTVGMALQGGNLRVRCIENGKEDRYVLIPITNIAYMQEMGPAELQRMKDAEATAEEEKENEAGEE